MRKLLPRLLVPLALIALALSLVAISRHTSGAPVHAAAAATQGQSSCIAHHPQEYIWYSSGCTGHDEPELDPISTNAGSARDITWTVQLPSNGSTQVDAVGPTFWIGGVVTDPNSLFGQAFLELQFYPNSLVSSCTAGGGFNVNPVPGDYTVCSPVWAVSPNGKREYAAFNAMLADSADPSGKSPLVMHAGDTITDHQYATADADGTHITVTDLTTSHSGTIVLNANPEGPLMPAYDVQQTGNDLQWGLVDDAPNSFVWEIGHTSPFTKPPSQFCLPGSATNPACFSYNISTWLGFHPLRVLGVKFGDGSSPSDWAVASDFGGVAEINQYCGAANYGTPFCTYPWYAFNAKRHAFTYGGNYAGTTNDFGKALEFAQTTQCPSPFGPNTDYCSTSLGVK